jgi:hypothetical protein
MHSLRSVRLVDRAFLSRVLASLSCGLRLGFPKCLGLRHEVSNGGPSPLRRNQDLLTSATRRIVKALCEPHRYGSELE